MLPLDDRAGLDDAARSALASSLASLGTLADVIRWGLAEAPAALVVDVIVQDEFTHDVIVAWRGAQHLVFDTT